MADPRFVLVGGGAMGQNHARVLAGLGNPPVAVVDADLARARGVAATCGAQPFATLRAAAQGTAPDAAIIAAPTQVHEPLAVEAFEAGLHVLVEKPIAGTVAAGRRIVAASRRADRVLAVGHVERHNPAVAATARFLGSGEGGRALTLSTRRVSNLPGRIRDVGCILDIGIHDLDVLDLLVGGAPESVFALGGAWTPGLAFEDHAVILLRYPGGVKGVVEVNWLTQRKVRKLAVTCERAYVECDYMEQAVDVSTTRHVPAPGGETRMEHPTRRLETARQEPLRIELQDFSRAIATGSPPLAHGPSSLRSLAVAEAALRSLASGRPERPEDT